MDKLEVIDKSNYTKCFRCSGTGKENNNQCPTCNGTGKWKENSYIHIYTDKNGGKQAFQSDFIK